MAKKESVLDDSASIYTKRTKQSEKQKWSEMDRRERLQYFKDYYLKFVLSGITVLVLLIFFLISNIKNRHETLLFIAVVNDYWHEEQTEQLSSDIKDYLGSTDSKEIVDINDSFFIDSASSSDGYSYLTKIIAYVSTGEIDMISADETQFRQFAKEGFFYDLREILPADLYSKLEDRIIWETIDYDDGTSGTLPIGIALAGTTVYSGTEKEFGVGNYNKEAFIGIVANTPHLDSAIKAVEYIFSK